MRQKNRSDVIEKRLNVLEEKIKKHTLTEQQHGDVLKLVEAAKQTRLLELIKEGALSRLTEIVDTDNNNNVKIEAVKLDAVHLANRVASAEGTIRRYERLIGKNTHQQDMIQSINIKFEAMTAHYNNNLTMIARESVLPQNHHCDNTCRTKLNNAISNREHGAPTGNAGRNQKCGRWIGVTQFEKWVNAMGCVVGTRPSEQLFNTWSLKCLDYTSSQNLGKWWNSRLRTILQRTAGRCNSLDIVLQMLIFYEGMLGLELYSTNEWYIANAVVEPITGQCRGCTIVPIMLANALRRMTGQKCFGQYDTISGKLQQWGGLMEYENLPINVSADTVGDKESDTHNEHASNFGTQYDGSKWRDNELQLMWDAIGEIVHGGDDGEFGHDDIKWPAKKPTAPVQALYSSVVSGVTNGTKVLSTELGRAVSAAKKMTLQGVTELLSNWQPLIINHNAVYTEWTNGKLAASDHHHDATYSRVGHEHGEYVTTPQLDEYSKKNHTHEIDERYARVDHTHDEMIPPWLNATTAEPAPLKVVEQIEKIEKDTSAIRGKLPGWLKQSSPEPFEIETTTQHISEFGETDYLAEMRVNTETGKLTLYSNTRRVAVQQPAVIENKVNQIAAAASWLASRGTDTGDSILRMYTAHWYRGVTKGDKTSVFVRLHGMIERDSKHGDDSLATCINIMGTKYLGKRFTPVSIPYVLTQKQLMSRIESLLGNDDTRLDRLHELTGLMSSGGEYSAIVNFFDVPHYIAHGVLKHAKLTSSSLGNLNLQ